MHSPLFDRIHAGVQRLNFGVAQQPTDDGENVRQPRCVLNVDHSGAGFPEPPRGLLGDFPRVRQLGPERLTTGG